MQENLKKEMLLKVLRCSAICLLLLLVIAILLVAVLAPVFTSKGVASAIDISLPDNGKVGANIVNVSDFSVDFTYFTNYVTDNWRIVSGASLLYNEGVSHTFNSNGVGQLLYIFNPHLSSSMVGSDYILSIGCSSGVYSVVSRNISLGNYTGDPITTPSGIRIRLRSNSNDTIFIQFSSVDSSVSSELVIYWVKLELGSTFTGYVPNYENSIAVLNNKLNQANADKVELQTQYNNLLNSMDFSTFNSVDLVSTLPYPSSVGGTPIFSSKVITASFNGSSYGGYYYYRSSVENSGLARNYLCQFDIGSTLPANSDIKLTYDAIFPYQGSFPSDCYVLLSLSNFGLSSDSSNLKSTVVAIPSSDFINGSIILNINHDVNYIAFDLGVSNGSGGYNIIDLGMPDKLNNIYQGLFIYNFVVSGRGSNFNVAIENANKQGYNKGYQEGKIAGETVGYQLGVKDQGDYTFMGLLGAVFDAPIQAFKGLLNFEILGVDMTAFVSSLFALAIIVLIIKISLGGK